MDKIDLVEKEIKKLQGEIFQEGKTAEIFGMDRGQYVPAIKILLHLRDYIDAIKEKP